MHNLVNALSDLWGKMGGYAFFNIVLLAMAVLFALDGVIKVFKGTITWLRLTTTGLAAGMAYLLIRNLLP